MKRSIFTRVIAAVLSATLFMGMMVSGAGVSAKTVEAATNPKTETLAKAFDANFYANKYADVKAAFGTDSGALFNHFMTCGMKEGRMINANFDPKAYCDAYPDIKALCKGDYTPAYDHYLTYGMKEGRNLTTYEEINKKKAADAAAAAAAEDAKLRAASYQLNIGHGLVVTLNGYQYRSCTIVVMKDDHGYGAYIDDKLYATSGSFDRDDVYHYSTVYVNNGNISEEVKSHHHSSQKQKTYDEDEMAEGFMLALLLAAMADDEDDNDDDYEEDYDEVIYLD
jgi:hypothetical protein